jgi:hypothetical protein
MPAFAGMTAVRVEDSRTPTQAPDGDCITAGKCA